MARLFGTDGVRGLANRDLTAELALDLAVSAAHVLVNRDRPASSGRSKPLAVVARDPRASGELLEAAVVAGIASAGVDVLVAGVIPTPAAAYITAKYEADFGVMISASHNAMPDNGIKIFAAGGHKLLDDVEAEIESRLGEQWERPVGAAVGRVTRSDGAAADYVGHLLTSIPHSLEGLTLVVDCANGAASAVGPEAYEKAGARVIAIHAAPDGLNINEDCGSTHLDKVTAAVLEHGADIGLAHDGDADRCLAVDAEGNVVDGDQILTVLGAAMQEAGTLRNSTVVATVMANLGFRKAMESLGITVVSTDVGDRYVLEAMREGDFVLGGEQSGHVICSEYATTGDGVLTGLMLAARIAQTGRSLAELAAAMHKLPQVLVNVPNVDKAAVPTNEAVQSAIRAEEQVLLDQGRVLLRPSGTEPLVRVMVEAPTEAQARESADRLAEAVRQHLSISG